jgi:hypothetical protein
MVVRWVHDIMMRWVYMVYRVGAGEAGEAGLGE